MMRLRVSLPNELFLDCEVKKIVAEARNGHFCLLPKHVDFVAALPPGLLAFIGQDDVEQFIAVDLGVLVKCGAEVSVSTRDAARGGDLGQLHETVQRQFESVDSQERLARSAAARLEAGLVRRFMEFDRLSN